MVAHDRTTITNTRMRIDLKLRIYTPTPTFKMKEIDPVVNFFYVDGWFFVQPIENHIFSAIFTPKGTSG